MVDFFICLAITISTVDPYLKLTSYDREPFDGNVVVSYLLPAYQDADMRKARGILMVASGV